MKANQLLRELKDDLRYAKITLEYLGFDLNRWENLTTPKFLTMSEEHYLRRIRGAKWLRPARREDLSDDISELFKLVTRAPKHKQTGLDQYASHS